MEEDQTLVLLLFILGSHDIEDCREAPEPVGDVPSEVYPSGPTRSPRGFHRRKGSYTYRTDRGRGKKEAHGPSDLTTRLKCQVGIVDTVTRLLTSTEREGPNRRGRMKRRVRELNEIKTYKMVL